MPEQVATKISVPPTVALYQHGSINVTVNLKTSTLKDAKHTQPYGSEGLHGEKKISTPGAIAR